MLNNRDWMYRKPGVKTKCLGEFMKGVEEFLDFAYSHSKCVDRGKIRCPSNKCDFLRYETREHVQLCLIKHGFRRNYHRWTRHGEPPLEKETNDIVDEENMNWPRDMVLEAAGPLFDESDSEGPSNGSNKFYEMLQAADEPLWEGCKKHTKLSAVTRLLYLKSQHGMTNICIDDLLTFIKELLPDSEKMPESYYCIKAMVKTLGLSYEKIHACENDCALFWGENSELNECPTCNESIFKPQLKDNGKKVPQKVLRYFPLTPRLQRLYLSSKTAEHMRWHSDKRCDAEGELRHPADGDVVSPCSSESLVGDVDPNNRNQRQAKRRGVSMGIKPPKNGQEPQLVLIVDNTFDSDQARNKIVPIIKANYDEAHLTWGDYSTEEKEFLWNDYLEYFQFRPQDMAMARVIWERLSKTNFPKMMCVTRKKAIEDYGSLSAAWNHHPNWLTMAQWHTLLAHWMTDGFKKCSELMKKNRTSGSAIPHASGSIPYAIRRKRQAKILGRQPNPIEAFTCTYISRRTGDWISHKAKDRRDAYARNIIEEYGPNNNKPLHRLKDPGWRIWARTVGIKKGMLARRPGEKWSKRSTAPVQELASNETPTDVDGLRDQVSKLSKENAALRRRLEHNNLENKGLTEYFTSHQQILMMVCAKIGLPPPGPPPYFPSYHDSSGDSGDDTHYKEGGSEGTHYEENESEGSVSCRGE